MSSSSFIEDSDEDLGRESLVSESQASISSEYYAGMPEHAEANGTEIVGPHGTVRGVRNRVRAGLANFESLSGLRAKTSEKHKIIVYTTSFRGVRSTFEDCKYVLLVLHNLRMEVDERDTYTNPSYITEMEKKVGCTQCKLPQVFIGGRHIGSNTEVEELNESGELRVLLADFPLKDTKAQPCEICGGYRFILCRKCGGSKNSTRNTFTSEFRALKCTKCNHNGLEPCPKCTTANTE
ncbi:hypothetical protein EMCRGX_G033951 [Ephydatia muelleri]